MATYGADAEFSHPLDFNLVQNGFVTMFWDQGVLAASLSWLADHGYQVAEIDVASCQDTETLLDRFAETMNFPDYFGRNLMALNDCMSDVARGDYGADLDPKATGLVLVLRRYDAFATRECRDAHAILDIFAGQARIGALFGHRMMCLVQSDDPHLTFPSVGATTVGWNPAEWLTSKRGQVR